jgi:hypothetical protein
LAEKNEAEDGRSEAGPSAFPTSAKFGQMWGTRIGLPANIDPPQNRKAACAGGFFSFSTLGSEYHTGGGKRAKYVSV